MPILTYESDGYSVSPAVLRQVDVHIQQVLDRVEKNRGSPPNICERAAGLIKSLAARWETIGGQKPVAMRRGFVRKRGGEGVALGWGRLLTFSGRYRDV